MTESLIQLRELIFRVTFIPIAVLVVLLATAAAGLWRGRWRKVGCAISLVAVLCAFLLGLVPHAHRGQEWKEVLFNGQLL